MLYTLILRAKVRSTHMNRYSKIIDIRPKINADNYIRAGWELLETRTVAAPSTKSKSTLIYRLGWPASSGQPVEPPLENAPLEPAA